MWSACARKRSRATSDALLKFAARAYRRPLSKAERDDILAYYHSLREKNGLTHEDAIRYSMVSVLMSPDFCYRIDLLDARASQTTVPVASAVTGRPLSGVRAGQPAELFSVVQHAGPGVAGSRGGGRFAKDGRADWRRLAAC